MKKTFTLEQGVRVIAGSVVLISLLLGLLVSRWWFALTAFVGLNLLQSAFTGFCPAEIILHKAGCKARCGGAQPSRKEQA
ncbi:MAG: DUF2892 domain-containing protein [Candidatus Omnitrophica bacterium]|nr:DUF2892 domain-containing protein [Candidatus Omnitrophota bacterium]